MKKTVKLSLTALCLGLLTACSSGDDDDSKGISAAQVAQPVNATTATTKGTATNVAANGLKAATVSNDSLTVDGTTFSLVASGVNSPEYHVFANNIELVRAVEDHGQYFGFTSKGAGSQRYAYYGSRQAETQNIPTTGSMRYEGDVVYSYGGPAVNDADVELFADFGNKRISGFMVGSHYGNVAVDATINNSGFAGQATAGNVKADLEGKFYGAGATSVAGAFGNAENTLGGAFAADRD